MRARTQVGDPVVERRLISTSAFLSQGELEMVNFVFSSSAIFYTGSLKLHKGVIKQLDKYRKHYLWKGADLNLKKHLRLLGLWFAILRSRALQEIL
jgi:hypothetical protein